MVKLFGVPTEKPKEVEEGPFPVQPIRNIVVIRRKPYENKTGLVLPGKAKERLATDFGTVVAVGPGLRALLSGELIPMDIRVGDKVMFGEYSGSPIKHKGLQYMLMPDQDVVAILSDCYDPDMKMKDGEVGGTPPPPSRILKPTR